MSSLGLKFLSIGISDTRLIVYECLIIMHSFGEAKLEIPVFPCLLILGTNLLLLEFTMKDTLFTALLI